MYRCCHMTYWVALARRSRSCSTWLLELPSPYDWVMVVKYSVNVLVNVMIAELLISIPALQKFWGSEGTAAGAENAAGLFVARFSARGHRAAAAIEHREWPELRRAARGRSRTAAPRSGQSNPRRSGKSHAVHQLAIREMSRSITRQGRFDLDSLTAGWGRLGRCTAALSRSPSGTQTAFRSQWIPKRWPG